MIKLKDELKKEKKDNFYFFFGEGTQYKMGFSKCDHRPDKYWIRPRKALIV